MLRDYKDNPAYNVPAFRLFNEKPDETLLHQAIEQVVQGNNILKTSFKIAEQYIYPIVNKAVSVNLEPLKLTLTTPQNLEQGLMDALYDKIKLPFDIEQPPLLRVYFIIINEQKFGLLMILHHMICDGTSAEILMKKIEENYLALTNPATANGKTLQYYDYSLYVENTLSVVNKNVVSGINYLKTINRQLLSESIDITKEAIANSPILSLGQKIMLPASMQEQVQQFCYINKVTPYTFFMGIFGLTLADYYKQQLINLLAVRSGRQESAINEAIGFFADGIPLLIQVESTESGYFQKTQLNLLQALDSNPGPVPFYQLMNSELRWPKFTYNFYKSAHQSTLFAKETKDYIADSIFEKAIIPNWNYKAPEHVYLMAKDINNSYSCYLMMRYDLYSKKDLDSFVTLFVKHCEIACKNS